MRLLVPLPSKRKGRNMRKFLENIIFSARWVLYPINLGLLAALFLYVAQFIHDDYIFLVHGSKIDLESMMVVLLGFVDASMVANLIIMIIQGGHQIFINKFRLDHGNPIPQYLEHIDTGILKVKVALSIAGITLVQILKDFFNIEKIEWSFVFRRIEIHVVALMSALIMACIWRITHPTVETKANER